MSSNQPNGNDISDHDHSYEQNENNVVMDGLEEDEDPSYNPEDDRDHQDMINVSSDDDDAISIDVGDSDDSVDFSDPNQTVAVVLRRIDAQNVKAPTVSLFSQELDRSRLQENAVETKGDSSEEKRELRKLTPDNETAKSVPTSTVTSAPGLPDRLKQCNLCKKPGDLACGGCFYVVYCCAEHQLEDWNSHQKPCCYYSLHRGSSIVYQGPFRFRTKISDATTGFQMEALCHIPRKTVISEETPFFVAPWPRLKIRKSETTMTRGLRPLCLTCFGCCKMLQFDFRTCCTCNIPICSDGCPSISKHKENECQYLKQMQCSIGQPDKFDSRTQGTTLMDEQATELFYIDIMILRFILLHKKLQQECGDNEKWNEKWARLNATWKISEAERGIHSKRGKLISHNMEATLPLSYFVTKGNHEVIWNIFCILEENMLVMDLPFRRLKVLCNATINARHSCTPNSLAFLKYDENYNLDNLVMAIVSGKALEPGEPITISYCPLILPTVQRQPFIMEQYLFWCRCPRCVDPSECGTHTSSMKCPVCLSSYMTPPAALANKPDLISPPNYKYASYNWSCTNIGRCPSISNSSSYENTSSTSTHKALQSSAVLFPKLERYEQESVLLLGNYQKTQRFIRTRSGDLHPNSHIFLKLYDDILRGALFPIVGDKGEHLTEFSIEWLKTLSKAKEAYTLFMKKICPAFDYQGFPEVNHMLMEMEFHKLTDSTITSSSVSVNNIMDDLGTMLLRPAGRTTIRPIINGLHHYVEIRRPINIGSVGTARTAASTMP